MLEFLEKNLLVGFSRVDDLVDGVPVREPCNSAVVDEDIGIELARQVPVLRFFEHIGRIAVDCPELHTSLLAPLDSVVEEFSFPHGPEDKSVALCDKHSQHLACKRFLLADGRILVFHNRSVKIDSNYHNINIL